MVSKSYLRTNISAYPSPAFLQAYRVRLSALPGVRLSLGRLHLFSQEPLGSTSVDARKHGRNYHSCECADDCQNLDHGFHLVTPHLGGGEAAIDTLVDGLTSIIDWSDLHQAITLRTPHFINPPCGHDSLSSKPSL